MCIIKFLRFVRRREVLKGVWRNGSASDSRSEGWVFESLYPHFFYLSSLLCFHYDIAFSLLYPLILTKIASKCVVSLVFDLLEMKEDSMKTKRRSNRKKDMGCCYSHQEAF